MNERIYAIRGAISPVSNTREDITAKTVELIKKIIDANDLRDGRNRIVSIIISSASDLTEFCPATAVRLSGIANAPLFSCVEPDFKGGMPGTVRVLVTAAYVTKPMIKHIYLGDAANLRPDLNYIKIDRR